MCGRYRLSAKERYLRDHFGLEEDPAWTPRYNIAPAQMVPIIRQDHKEPRRTFSLVRWGLIPYWAEDASIGFKTINAVSETAAEKPAFRDAMRWRRCLVPANGFYEWKRLGLKEKQAHNFGRADDGILRLPACGKHGEIALPTKRSRPAQSSRRRPTLSSPVCTIECP
jgi:putative SOS response-associated peptidase YedK